MRPSPSIVASLLLAAAPAAAFVPRPRGTAPSLPPSSSLLRAGGGADDERRWAVDEKAVAAEENANSVAVAKLAGGFPNPLAELGDMLSNFDDVVDDFFNKRMGNGEVFYGKRRYKPSGKISSDYNGGGLSDWRKIEAAREFREERARRREAAAAAARGERELRA